MQRDFVVTTSSMAFSVSLLRDQGEEDSFYRKFNLFLIQLDRFRDLKYPLTSAEATRLMLSLDELIQLKKRLQND